MRMKRPVGQVDSRKEPGLNNTHLRHLGSRMWRICNLYYILDKDNKCVQFKPNAEQLEFLRNAHGRDLILKARQLGFTTLACIIELDAAMFEHKQCALIAHNKDDAARFFRNKVKFAYDRLPKKIRQANPATVTRTGELVFKHGGSVTVSVSFRGGTVQYMHISEFGKICATAPLKAAEIISGALEAVPKSGKIIIESTAEGAAGDYYEMCMEALRQKRMGAPLSPLDWNIFFFAWWQSKDYRLEPDEVGAEVTPELHAYFDGLVEKGWAPEITLDQRRWYAGKLRTQRTHMKQEYPSYPEEAFAQSISGTYYTAQFTDLYRDNRILPNDKFPHNDHLPVHTAWDIGVSDYTAIWFYRKVGEAIHLIDFYANTGEGLQHYMTELKRRADVNGWTYGTHWAPHDIDNREWGSEALTRRQIAAAGKIIDGHRYSLVFTTVPRSPSINDGIEQVRSLLPRCVFNATTCGGIETDAPDVEDVRKLGGLPALEQYRKGWNSQQKCWTGKPLHNNASHAADAFRYLAVAELRKPRQTRRRATRGLM